MKKIPSGKVRTHKQIVILVGGPNSYRAVGNACANNPNPKDIPYHRAVKSNKDLGGYSLKGGKKKRNFEIRGIKF